jgi:hypothetical protein
MTPFPTSAATASLAVVFLAFAAQAQDAPVIDPLGVPPIGIGMKLEAAKGFLPGLEVYGQPGDACFVAGARKPQMELLFEDGEVTRIYVTDPALKTASGIGPGSSEADLLKAYGEALAAEPAKYVEGGRVFTLLGNGVNGLQFETDGKTVSVVSAGTGAALAYTERCG